MARQAVPAPFTNWVDLSSDLLGTFVLYATDEYFAEKENLLKPEAPVWLEDEYTSKGKWMDGWESQRRREEGHDFVIVRLGAPGHIRGVLVDTTHFKGNAPQQISVDGVDAPHTATATSLGDTAGWVELIPRSPVRADFQNVFELRKSSHRFTHLRLHIYPDGGVARLRVFGDVAVEDRAFWRSGSVDLAAIENGGTIAAVSDEFYGPPQNMLLPGRGVNMGDGWETKRRRTPGSDWAVIRLARRGVLERIELDTHFFKGNAPQATVLEALDGSELSNAALQKRLHGSSGWRTLLGRTPLVQHRRHVLEPSRPMACTHVRVHIFPHGGVNRLRLFGHAVDVPWEETALHGLNTLDGKRARELFLSFCGSPRWADTLVEARPFSSIRHLFEASRDIWWSVDGKDWVEAFAAHPRIGETKKARAQSARSAAWSKGEQQNVAAADASVLERLSALNGQYLEKFGFIFIVFATGKSASEMRELLETRIRRSKAQELETAAEEQAKITQLRIEKWLAEQRAKEA